MKSLSQHPHICEILLWSKDSRSKPSNDPSRHLIAQVRLKSYDHRYVIPRRNIVTTSFDDNQDLHRNDQQHQIIAVIGQ